MTCTTDFEDIAGLAARMKAAGYTPYHTGGNCMVWSHEDGDRWQWICSDDSGLYGLPEARIWIAGVYGRQGDDFINVEPVTLDEALSLVATLRDPAKDEQVLLHPADVAPYLDGTREAMAIATKWVARFGLGFHPDTRGKDYCNADYSPCLTFAEAAEYEADMDRLFGLGDAYEFGLQAMRNAGLLKDGE